MTGLLWRFLVSTTLLAMPDFVAPTVLAGSWMFAKWIAVDAAEFVTDSGAVRYRVGLYTTQVHRVFDCPVWVTMQQIAEIYGSGYL